MLEEALKWVGPYPLVQLFGSLALLAFGIKSMLAGAKSGRRKEDEEVEIELPDWYVDEHKEMRAQVQRTMWYIEAIWNKMEMGRGPPPPPMLPPG